jgi:hypothetical protein
MNKIVLGAWALCFALGMGFGLTACGGSPCDDLKDRCRSDCPEGAVEACVSSVDLIQQLGGGNADDACDAALEDFTCN